MISQYLRAAMSRAHYEILPDGEGYFGEIPGFDGLWAKAANLESCRDQLEQSLESWLLLSIARNMPVPEMDGLDLSVKEVV